MASKSKGGGPGLLLLAGLGVGAFLLLNNKPSAASQISDGNADSFPAMADDIPAVPKIVAVNTSATESPLPTGIVSDEDGMMPTTVLTQSAATSSSGASDWDDDTETDSYGSSSPLPKLVSTKLTEKEKAIITKGALTNELAVQRPDLYKAIYVKKHGQNGKGQQALKAANAAIQQIKVKSGVKPEPTQAKKRKVALKLNTRISPKVAPSRKPTHAAKATKPAPKPLVLAKRPAPAGKHPASKSQPGRAKVAPKRPVRPAPRKAAPAKKPVRH